MLELQREPGHVVKKMLEKRAYGEQKFVRILVEILLVELY